MVYSEVSRGHSTAWREGLNVRMAKESGSLWQSDHSGNTLENYLLEDRTESESKVQEELSRAVQPMCTMPGKVFF